MCVDTRNCTQTWYYFVATECDVILVEHITWGDAEAVVAMSFSAMGLMATFVTCHIFIRHNDTPVVKASTRELSYLILAGMTLAHITVSLIFFFHLLKSFLYINLDMQGAVFT